MECGFTLQQNLDELDAYIREHYRREEQGDSHATTNTFGAHRGRMCGSWPSGYECEGTPALWQRAIRHVWLHDGLAGYRRSDWQHRHHRGWTLATSEVEEQARCLVRVELGWADRYHPPTYTL